MISSRGEDIELDVHFLRVTRTSFSSLQFPPDPRNVQSVVLPFFHEEATRLFFFDIGHLFFPLLTSFFRST